MNPFVAMSQLVNLMKAKISMEERPLNIGEDPMDIVFPIKNNLEKFPELKDEIDYLDHYVRKDN